MKDTEAQALVDDIEALARRAGELILEGYRNPETRADKKGEVDLVTEYDLRSERLITDHLRKAYPEMAVVGEEADGPDVRGDDGALTWYVDPIDGTTNYVHGHPFFCVSIGLCRGGVPLLGVVHAPALRLLWRGIVGLGATRNGVPCQVSTRDTLQDSLLATGFPYDRATSEDNNYREFVHLKSRTRGVRRCGSAALDLALTADGTYDAYWEYKLNPWDFAAGAALVLAAKGKVTNDGGSAADLRTGALVASNAKLHDTLLQELREVREGRPFPTPRSRPSEPRENG